MRSTGLVTAASVLAVSGALIVFAGARAQEDPIPAPGALDGKTFIGDRGEEEKRKVEAETFEFKNGSFEATGCRRWGFGAALYTASVDGDTVIFQTETASPKEGKMRWSGTVRNGELKGRMTWYRTKKGPAKYWFRGTQQPQGEPPP